MLTELGVGEALVSLLDEKGGQASSSAPGSLAPGSRIGPATPEERKRVIEASAVFGHYEKTIDRESAYEKLKEAAGAKMEAAGAKPAAPGQAGGGSVMDVLGGILMGGTGPRGGRREGVLEAAAKSGARSVGSQVGREIIRGVLGSLLGGGTARRR